MKNEILLEENQDFLNDYIPLLINRVTHSTMSLETDIGDPDIPKNAIKLKDNMKAFELLLYKLNFNEQLSEDLIIDVANIINRSNMFITDGYRKVGNTIGGTNILISKPENIRRDLIKLIDDYNNNWNNLDPFLKEAQFHIKFIRIHPFEDGNGRTARLILNYNLLRKKIAPVILTEDLNEYYQQIIKNYNVEELAKLLKYQSFQEDKVINQLFEEYETAKNKRV